MYICNEELVICMNFEMVDLVLSLLKLDIVNLLCKYSIVGEDEFFLFDWIS